MYGGLARHIVLQTTLQDDDLYMRQWTERTYGPHPAGPPPIDPEQDKQARDRAKLLGVTADAKLDDVAVENNTYRQAFENYQHFFKSLPGAAAQQQALTALRRMFIKREQINQQLGLRTFDTDSYALVIMGLATEV